jgi:2-polyprenyl-6-methoxyphenol hydroxylase-like FAD-dependent oxidoreductase
VGAGISLWPNAIKALQKLGLGGRLSSISMTNLGSALRRWDGAILSRTSSRELRRRFGGVIVIFHRADLLDMLANHLGHTNIHLDHALLNLKQDQTSVTATFANGATARGDVLIGADGVHSQVQAQLGHTDRIRYSGYTAWRSVVPFDYASFVPAETWGPGRRFGAFPIQGKRVYWFATKQRPAGPARSGKRSTVAAVVTV